jgi:hypothetical protein
VAKKKTLKFSCVQKIAGSKRPLLVDASSSAGGDSLDEPRSSAKLWSRLHLLVLQTIMSFPSLPGARQLELITLADMNQTVKDVVAHVQMTSNGIEDDNAATAVNRLVQVLQVALATGAFRCSLSE